MTPAVSALDVAPWEPEESVGKLWHRLASRFDPPAAHDDARVELSEIAGRLAVFFRGLGGTRSVEIRAVAPEVSRHRLSFRRKLAVDAEHVTRASFDGETLRLPQSIAILPSREANAALYLWLAAAAAHAERPTPAHADPLRADLAALSAARDVTRRTLEEAPGLAALHSELAAATLALRPRLRLPPVEQAVEAAVRRLLGADDALSAGAQAMLAAVESGAVGLLRAPDGYRPFRPVALWPDFRALRLSAPSEDETHGTGAKAEEDASRGARKARRRTSDRANDKNSLVLHRFEAILSFAEFLNLSRRVEDDDIDNAKKAADDQDEIGLGQIAKSPATRLKLHLDLAPEDVDREALSAELTYPEWDARAGAYLPAHVRVLVSPAAPDPQHAVAHDARARRRIRAVRRQFEAMRPARVAKPGHIEGDDLDLDAAVRSRVDALACGQGTERIWRQARPLARDLAISILLDVSRSTEAVVRGGEGGGRMVIEVEREALTAFAWGLHATGDAFAIHAFSSLRRNRVYVLGCKSFDEPMSATVEARIAALKPAFYTRLGAAIRHVSASLSRRPSKRRLLLVITDGKPNDLDHYEGRHGIEDARMAVREAGRAGQVVFGITVDRDGQSWFPRMFGPGGYALIPHADRLTLALPEIYRRLVGA